MRFTAPVPDPTDVDKVVDQAYCEIVEFAVDRRNRRAMFLIECWRSHAAYESKKQPFASSTLLFDKDSGGDDMLERIDSADLTTLPGVLRVRLQEQAGQ
jgi:hypothetical protein